MRTVGGRMAIGNHSTIISLGLAPTAGQHDLVGCCCVVVFINAVPENNGPSAHHRDHTRVDGGTVPSATYL